MQLQKLKDSELLAKMKSYVQSERDLLIPILHHLREIERRRLFSDLGYSSLFDYAVGELRYSEGQATRRIQAMRLLKEVPQVESKIADGTLSLSNIQKANSFFREVQAAEPRRIVTPAEKLEVLEKLENKTTRDAEKELLKISPASALPKERERVVSETVSEVRFPLSDKLKAKLEGVRALLGPKGAMMSYAELFEAMSDISLSALEAKTFGKKRVEEKKAKVASVPAPKKQTLPSSAVVAARSATVARSVSRHIPKGLKHQVWQRDKGACTNCGGKRNLNYDHIKPFALGGRTTIGNLRLLCFQCNQRAGIRVFGALHVRGKEQRRSRDDI